MKALILSDIHSNIHALEAIWQQESDCDLVYCAGDLVDYGPYPREIVDWIRTHDIPCVQGNHDAWVALCYRRGDTLMNMPPDERAWVHHNAALLDEDQIAFLENLPKVLCIEIDGTRYGITHLYQAYDEIVSLHAFRQFCRQTFQGWAIDNLILGHTHRQAVRHLSNTVKWLTRAVFPTAVRMTPTRLHITPLSPTALFPCTGWHTIWRLLTTLHNRSNSRIPKCVQQRTSSAPGRNTCFQIHTSSRGRVVKRAGIPNLI